MPSLRHKWIKLRIHTYICTKCGCGKVNEEATGYWQARFHLPNGSSMVLKHVPTCEVGEFTEKYLAKYADLIAAGGMKEEAA